MAERHVSLEAINFEGRFIRHRNFLGELTPIESELDRKDATFTIGGTKSGDLVTIQSTNFPLHVLRHQDFRIRLHEFNLPFLPPPNLGGGTLTPEQDLLRKDVHFFWEPGLTNPSDPSLISFRSFNFRDRFIRHRNFHLFLEPVDSDLARRDATFKLREPLAPPPPVPLG